MWHSRTIQLQIRPFLFSVQKDSRLIRQVLNKKKFAIHDKKVEVAIRTKDYHDFLHVRVKFKYVKREFGIKT